MSNFHIQWPPNGQLDIKVRFCDLADGVTPAMSHRAYSPSALVALGKAADPQMDIEFLQPPSTRLCPRPMTAVFSRPTHASTPAVTKEGS